MTTALQNIKLSLIVPSPHNPRHILPDDPSIKELAISIAKCGLLQPVICRPQGKKFELVAGRRRYEAVKLLKLPDILAAVHDLADPEAIEVTVLENLQRENLSPMEQARGIQELLLAGNTVQQAAAKLGKSPRWLARRSSLSNLSAEWKRRIEDPQDDRYEMPIATLELIARYTHAQQDAMIDESSYWREETTDSIARDLDRAMSILAKAPFDTEDESLAECGACSRCQKRSSMAPLLFHDEDEAGEIQKNDKCLDRLCWDGKAAAAFKRKEEDLRAKHPKLIKIARSYEMRQAHKDAIEEWRVNKAKKSDKDAIPALDCDSGKLIWVKQGEYDLTPHGDDRQAGPKMLEQKEGELESKRWCEVVRRFRERMDDVPFDTLQGGHEVLCRLVAVFGTGDLLMDEGSTWKDFEEMENTDEAMWRHVCKQFRSMMKYEGPVTTFDIKDEQMETADHIAKLISFNLDSIYDQVKQEKGYTVPKSWNKDPSGGER